MLDQHLSRIALRLGLAINLVRPPARGFVDSGTDGQKISSGRFGDRPRASWAALTAGDPSHF